MKLGQGDSHQTIDGETAELIVQELATARVLDLMSRSSRGCRG